MSKSKDPLYWARSAAKHPLLEEYKPNPDGHTPATKILIAVSSHGHGLYHEQGHIWWCRCPDGSEMQSGYYRRDGRGWLPDPPPIHSGVEQPPRGGPRWHYLTDDENYAAQRLRIDPNWIPDVE